MSSSNKRSKTKVDDDSYEPLRLESIIGLTTLSNAALSCSSQSGETFYAAGCAVVRYNVDENKQKGFYKVSKAVSCLTVSSNGRLLAVGERGHSPSCVVFDVYTGNVVVTFKDHKHGIGALSFSPDCKYLVTVGFKHDKKLILWDLDTNIKISEQKLSNKVNSISFNYDGSYFVTAGDRDRKSVV
jgi:WD40 repeat protein